MLSQAEGLADAPVAWPSSVRGDIALHAMKFSKKSNSEFATA